MLSNKAIMIFLSFHPFPIRGGGKHE